MSKEKLLSQQEILVSKLEKEGKVENIDLTDLNVGLSEEEKLEMRIIQANNKREILKDQKVYGPESCITKQEK